MLVMMLDDQLLPSVAVCQSCLMADRLGRPRWQEGQLKCGRLLQTSNGNLPAQYECQMGFRLTCVEACRG